MPVKMDVKELNTYATNTWCPGCGNFGIERAIKLAVTELVNEGKIKRENVVTLSGIGCHAKIVDYINVNSFYSLHGRVPAPASGVKLANPELTVIGFAGDGDAYSEGLVHLVFAAKRNMDITMIVHDNRVFGLTTGQFTPTSPKGFKGRSMPRGAPEEPFNPIELMLVSGATFVARGYSGKVNDLKALMKRAILHRGFAIIDVLQPCFTFFNTYDYYNKAVYDIQAVGHNEHDWDQALAKAREWDYGVEEKARIPIGVFYETERPTFGDAVGAEKGLISRPVPVFGPLLKDHI